VAGILDSTTANWSQEGTKAIREAESTGLRRADGRPAVRVDTLHEHSADGKSVVRSFGLRR
jgi:hypothetical protein